MDDLRARAQSLYGQADDAAGLPRAAFAQAAGDMQGRLADMAIDPMLTPSAARVASNIGDAAAAVDPAIGFRELDILRRQSAIPAGTIGNNAERALGAAMIDGIDEFIETVDPQLGSVVREARDMWSRLRRSEVVEAAIERAGRQASGFENGLRVQFRAILNNPRLVRGFTQAERDVMEGVVRGTPFGNLMRQVGKLGIGLGGNSNALGATAGAIMGGTMGGPLAGVIVPALATGARAVSDSMTSRLATALPGYIAAGPAAQTLPQVGRGIIEELTLRAGRAAPLGLQ
jgi:hypothetical protein